MVPRNDLGSSRGYWAHLESWHRVHLGSLFSLRVFVGENEGSGWKIYEQEVEMGNVECRMLNDV